MEELRDVNNLNYKIPISSNVIAQASANVYNFNPNYYEATQDNDLMIVEFQEGDNFIDPQNSFIRLKLRINDANGTLYSFGKVGAQATGQDEYYDSNTGESVLNLIKHVELVTKTGEKLFQENFKNEMATLTNYKCNIGRRNFLSIMGGYSNVRGFPFFAQAKDTTFHIPLSEISPFFHSTMIPNKLLSGAVLRITLANVAQSIYNYTLAGGNIVGLPRNLATTATISNVALILSEKQVYPDVKEVINKKINSPEGLEYAYYQNHTFAYKFEESFIPTTYTIPVNLSVGKIKYIALKPITPLKNSLCYPSAKWKDFIYPTGLGYDQKLPFKIKIRLGNDVLSTYDVETIPEMWEQTTKALSNISFQDCHDVDIKRKINKKTTGLVGYHDYFNYYTEFNTDPDLIDTSGLVFAFDFERSSSLGVSGVSTNIERLLEIDISDYIPNYINGTPSVNTWYVSIMYLTQADLFADGSIAVNK